MCRTAIAARERGEEDSTIQNRITLNYASKDERKLKEEGEIEEGHRKKLTNRFYRQCVLFPRGEMMREKWPVRCTTRLLVPGPPRKKETRYDLECLDEASGGQKHVYLLLFSRGRGGGQHNNNYASYRGTLTYLIPSTYLMARHRFILASLR